MKTSCRRAGGRHDASTPLQVDTIFIFIRQVAPVPACWLFKTSPTSWPLTIWPWKWCPSHVWRGLPLLILVFLGLSVLDFGPMYATDRRQTKASFNAPPYGGGGIIIHDWQVAKSFWCWNDVDNFFQKQWYVKHITKFKKKIKCLQALGRKFGCAKWMTKKHAVDCRAHTFGCFWHGGIGRQQRSNNASFLWRNLLSFSGFACMRLRWCPKLIPAWDRVKFHIHRVHRHDTLRA